MTGNLPPNYVPGQGFVQSPRLAMAQSLLAQGSSRAPVQSPLEGIARMLQAGIGGWMGGSAKQDEKDALTEALAAMNDPNIPANQRAQAAHKAYVAKYPEGSSPFLSAVVSSLSKTAESPEGKLIEDWMRLPDNHPQKNALALAIEKHTGNLPQGMRRNPETGAVEEVPNFGKVSGAIKQAESTGTAQGTKNVELAMNPQIIAAETGPKAQQEAAVTTARETAAMPFVGPKARQQTAGGIQGQLEPVANPDTTPGAPAEVPGVQAVKAAEAKAGEPGKQFDRANTLRDEFDNQTKRYGTVRNAFQKVQEASKLKTGPGDMALLYGYIKMLDADSAVREGEYATAANAASIPERIRQMYNRAIDGELMEDGVRQKFVQSAGTAYDVERRTYDTLAGRYTDMAKREGLKPENVVQPLERIGVAKPEGAPSPGAPSKLPPIEGNRFSTMSPGELGIIGAKITDLSPEERALWNAAVDRLTATMVAPK
jgi:hypothetical protein